MQPKGLPKRSAAFHQTLAYSPTRLLAYSHAEQPHSKQRPNPFGKGSHIQPIINGFRYFPEKLSLRQSFIR